MILIELGPDFVPGLPHVILIESGPDFVPGFPHLILIELRQALVSYQDYHMFSLNSRRYTQDVRVREALRVRHTYG